MRGSAQAGLWAVLVTSLIVAVASAQGDPSVISGDGSGEGSGVAPVAGTSASVAGVTLPDDGGPRLIVRHLTADGLVRPPSTVALTVGSPPTPVAVRGAVVPLAASGVDFTAHLVLDDGVLEGLPDGFEGSAIDDALVSALRNTFNPGERVGVSVVRADEGSGSGPSLAPGDDLAAIEAFVAEAWTRSAPRGAVLDAVGATLAEVPDDGRHHHEIVVVAWWSPSDAPVAELVTRSRDAGVPVSVALLSDATPDGVDPTAHPLCDLARQTGGVCRVDRTEGIARLVPRVMADAQLLYVTPVACAEGIAGMDRVAVVATTPAGASDPAVVPGPRIACETWQTFDPAWDPASVVAEGSGAVEGSSEAEGATIGGWPAPVVYGSSAGVGLLAILVLVVAARRRRSRFDLDDEVYTRGGAPSHRISALDNLAPNSGAAVLEARGPVPDRPAWLRHPALDPVRRVVRGWRSETADLHLVWSDGDGVRERALGGPVVVGYGPDCDVQIPGMTGAVLRLAPRGREVDVQVLAAGARVERNGTAVTGAIVARAGDEFVLDERVVLELRVLSTDGADAARSVAARVDRRRLVPRDERAFSAVEVGVTSVVLGRDPLPYRGVQSVPAKLVIAQVSNDHAEVWMSGGHLYVRDLGSSNGTLVGGLRIDPHVVTPVAEGQTLALSPLVVFTVR